MNRHVSIEQADGTTIVGELVMFGSTVGEFGIQGGEFFSVPCALVQTDNEIVTVPLTQVDGGGYRPQHLVIKRVAPAPKAAAEPVPQAHEQDPDGLVQKANEQHPESEHKLKYVTLTGEAIHEMGTPFVTAFTELKATGLDPAEIIGAMAFALGHELAAHGVVLPQSATLEQILPPLLSAYNATWESMRDGRKKGAH